MLAASRMPVVVVAVGKETEKNMSLLLLRKRQRRIGVCVWRLAACLLLLLLLLFLLVRSKWRKSAPKVHDPAGGSAILPWWILGGSPVHPRGSMNMALLKVPLGPMFGEGIRWTDKCYIIL